MFNKPVFYFLLISFFQTSVILNAQSLDWVHFYVGPTNSAGCIINTIDLDTQGNIITGGSFTQTIDFDPGPGVYLITASPSSNGNGIGDGFVMQSDTNGNTLWVKTFEGNGDLDPLSTDIDEFGNILILAAYHDTVDLDPGIGVLNITGSGRCVIKLDSSGNFIWAKSFDNTNGNFRMIEILAGKNGNIWISGGMDDSLDLDPGPGVFMMVNPNISNPSGFVFRLNANGDFINAFFTGNSLDGPDIVIGNDGDLWALGKFVSSFDADPGSDTTLLTAFSGTKYLQHLDSACNFISVIQLDLNLQKLALDSSGGVLMAGYFQGQVDADPGPGSYLINSSGANDICLIRLDTAGNFSWAGNYGSIIGVQLHGLTMGSDGNIYINGGFFGLTDFDPGTGTYEIGFWTSTGTNYVLKLDSAGNFIMVFPFTGRATSVTFISVLVLPGGSFYYCDNQKGIEDLDPGMGSLFFSTAWIKNFMLKMKPDSCSLLTFKTEELSAVKCSQPGSALCTVMSGSPPFQYSWNTTPPSSDSIAIVNALGSYTVTVTDNTGCSNSSTVQVSGPAFITQADLEVNMLGSALQLNTTTPISINVKNNGCTSISGNLMIVLDSLVIIDSVVPPPAITIGDSLVWFTQAMTYDDPPYTVLLYMRPNSSFLLGDSLCFTLSTQPPLNDADSTNNLRVYYLPVIGSWDPNIKLAYPVGACDDHYILPGSEITYSILFQNTGNAPAHNIMILDSLSPYLDFSTFRIDAVSHPLSTHILQGNVLRFDFENIMLPDSGSNLAGSNGYIIFSCRTDSTLPSGTVISNSAIIVFDNNEFVITDSVYHTIVSIIPNPDTSVTVQGTILTANQTPATYQWINCTNGGMPIAGATSQSYTAQANGSYAVQISQNGCSTQSSCHNILSVGVNDIDKFGMVLLYPNPGDDFVVVESNFNSESYLEVFNVIGELLLTRSFLDATKLDISKLSPGLYICRIRNSSLGVVSGYFIKNGK